MSDLKISSAEMVRMARARIREIDTAELMAHQHDPNRVIVDIRDVREQRQTLAQWGLSLIIRQNG